MKFDLPPVFEGDKSLAPSRAIAYIRTPGKGSEEDCAAQEYAQAERIKTHAESLGLSISAYYSDRGTSLRPGHRSGFDLASAHLDSGEVGCLMIEHIDRLTRSARDLRDIFAYLTSSNIRLVSVVDELDTARPIGLFIARVLSWLSTLPEERDSFATG